MLCHIHAIQLSRLQKIYNGFTKEFFNSLLAQIPKVGKSYENYYLINNTLTVNNPTNIEVINYFNTFVALSRAKAPLIQILINQ